MAKKITKKQAEFKQKILAIKIALKSINKDAHLLDESSDDALVGHTFHFNDDNPARAVYSREWLGELSQEYALSHKEEDDDDQVSDRTFLELRELLAEMCDGSKNAPVVIYTEDF